MSRITPHVAGLITLITGVGIAALVLIFVGTLGGQAYYQVEPDINSLGGEVTGESLGTADASGYLLATVQYTPVVENSETVYANGSALTNTSYTINYTTGQVEVNDPNVANATITIDYQWGDYEIFSNIKGAITGGFKSVKVTGNYLPLGALAIIMAIIIGIILLMMGGVVPTTGRYGGVL